MVGTCWASRAWCRDSRRTIQLTPSRCRLRPCRVLGDAKVHHRHRSISREARDKGSIHDTDDDRVVERRVRVLRYCVWHCHSVGHEEHDLRLGTCGQRLHLKLIRYLDVVCRYDWVQAVVHRRGATIRIIPRNQQRSRLCDDIFRRKENPRNRATHGLPLRGGQIAVSSHSSS